MAEHNDFGKKGEDIAVDYLLSKGYSIVRRNYRWRSAEVDIIAAKDGILSFVEVKARRSAYFGEPELFVSRQKQKSYIQAANAFVTENDRNEEVSFDIIAIVMNNGGTKINHIESAFSILG